MAHSSSPDGPLRFQRVGKACGRSKDFTSTKSEASSGLYTILPDQSTSETWDRTCDQTGFGDLWQKPTYQCGPQGEDFDLLDNGTQEQHYTPRAELHVQHPRNNMHEQSARPSGLSRQQPTNVDCSETNDMVPQTKKKRTCTYTEGTDGSKEICRYMGEGDNEERPVSRYGNTSDMSPMMKEYFFVTTERHERFWNFPGYSTAGGSQGLPEAGAEAEASPRGGSG